MKGNIIVLVEWLVVPVIILSVFFFAIGIIARTEPGDQKTSAKAGFWAGLVLFVAYVLTQLQLIKEPSLAPFMIDPLGASELVLAAFGCVAGIVMLIFVGLLGHTRVVGLVTLVLSASSAIALYTYIFVESLRRSCLIVALGFTFGALLYIALFPKSLTRIWGTQAA
jgi:hypothetical protein